MQAANSARCAERREASPEVRLALACGRFGSRWLPAEQAQRSRPLYRASRSWSAERDELELDVIRVPEHHRGVGQGLLLIPDTGVLDAELIELGRPGRQLIAGGHAEGQVVQPGAALIEGFPPIGLVEVQPIPIPKRGSRSITP